STASATITVDDKHTFADGTEYGNRRIFFTDNSGWGDGQVMVHYSNTDDDTNFSDGHTKAMTFKFINDASQRVYYADIPYSYKYVNFYKKDATSNYTDSALISNDANAYWHNGGTAPYAINTWQENYSDYVATDRETTIQQGRALKNEPISFNYTCDFGDAALTAEVVAGNAATFDFDKGKFYITPTENTYTYSLVKVKSSASTTEKYYLIRVDNFEIVDFYGLQKIYDNSKVIDNIQLDVIVKGGILDYAAKYFSSDTNKTGSYVGLEGKQSGFTQVTSIQSFINSFLLQYKIHSVSGTKYIKVEVTDGAGRVGSRTLKTLFGTGEYIGERCLYFYNASGENIENYNVRACFTDASDSNETFVTMQRVGNTNYYRATIPYDAQNNVNLYICHKDTFSNDPLDYDGSDSSKEICAFKVDNLSVPAVTNENIVYVADSFSAGTISGDFAEFDY
ncbi:MAG: hypothetical protein Q4A12_08045, partial [Eubacteriales bacterium]|nr:hypothetical protein [Eubacteriales bacterium]